MATIGSVLISVYAKTDGLRKSLKKAEKTIGNFAKKATKTLKSISVSLGVGAAAAITGIIVLVNKYATEIDKLAKNSSKLGITVKALQKLQYQAELTGLGADKFNKAFNKMTTVIADADNGLSTATRAFDKLGLSVEDLKSLSADKQFYAIAESMKAIGNQTEKLGLAKDIFGAGATGILNTLNSDLIETSKEFDALGISVTASGAKMVEAYQDSKTRLSAIFSGFGIQLTAQLAAPFKIVIGWITKLALDMGGMDKLANKFASAFIGGIETIIRAGAEFTKLINKWEIGLLKVSRGFLGLDKAMTLHPEKLTLINWELHGIDAQIKALTEKNNEIDLTINTDVKKKLDELRSSLGGDSGGGQQINTDINQAFGKAANDAITMADSTKKAADSVDIFSIAANNAARSLSPNVNKSSDLGDMSSRIKAQDIYKANPGLSGFSGGSGESDNKLLSIQGYIDASPSGKALQDYRKNSNGRPAQITAGNAGLIPDYFEGKNGVVSGDNLDKLINSKPSTKITLEMVTDNGKVAGELIGNQDFINAISNLQTKQTNQSAQQATM